MSKHPVLSHHTTQSYADREPTPAELVEAIRLHGDDDRDVELMRQAVLAAQLQDARDVIRALLAMEDHEYGVPLGVNEQYEACPAILAAIACVPPKW